MPSHMDFDQYAPQGEKNCSTETNYACCFQAANRSNFEPEQSAQNLAAIERINRNQIKEQQHDVHEPDGPNKLVEIWMNYFPMEPGDVKATKVNNGNKITFTSGPAAILQR